MVLSLETGLEDTLWGVGVLDFVYPRTTGSRPNFQCFPNLSGWREKAPASYGQEGQAREGAVNQ